MQAVYDKFLETLLDFTTATDSVDFINDVIKLACLTSAYSPSPSDEYWGDISVHEVSGTGYTAGGFTVTGKSAISSANMTIWAGSGINVSTVSIPDIRYLVLYKDTGTESTSKLMSRWDIGGQALIGKPLIVNFGQGILKFKNSQ